MVLIASLVLVAVPAGGAAAGGPVGGGAEYDDSAPTVVKLQISVVNSSDLERVASSTTSTNLIWVAVPVWSSGGPEDNYGMCRGWSWSAAQTQAEADRIRSDGRATYQMRYDTLFWFEFPGIGLDVGCEADPAEILPREVVADVARSVIAEEVPAPELSIPPGFGITGLPAYLVTGDEHALRVEDGSTTVTLDTYHLQVSFSAQGSTSVDWGDGAGPQHYHTPGLAWPNGTIEHTYTRVGNYDVSVTDHWDATFTVSSPELGGVVFSDSLSFEVGPFTIDQFRVEEYRAVRVAP
ncbi:MAG: hypothetical protein JJT89_13080 [Nitriliruptoraceae bacterium]|nr:hypothetical protein [Nitriliruptoraceae bacterium]